MHSLVVRELLWQESAVQTRSLREIFEAEATSFHTVGAHFHTHSGISSGITVVA